MSDTHKENAYVSSDKFASIIGSEQAEPANIVIFGASGDLSKRKLLPALAHMHRWNLLGPHSRIIGAVREPWKVFSRSF